MSHDAERQKEQNRVDKVVQEINIKEEKLFSKAGGLKESIVDLRKNFWEDVTVNLDEPDDVIETQASLKQQAELLAERERSHGSIGKELKTLRLLKESPYFGRIDFSEKPGGKKEKIYIGIASLMDLDDEEFLIYDWRAPISSLYYDFSPGAAYYETMDDTIEGEISLKRQFIIRQSKIKGMFDTGVTIGDSLLQAALGNYASTTMKSIVATIQREQNKIIRNEHSKLLIVQGVAGSGKTSAVLQRIAYLLYRFRDSLNNENLLLFSPNPLFSSYIANVLPELGETNISQTTFYDFLRDGIEKDIKIESPFEQMEFMLTEKDTAELSIRQVNMKLKSSIAYKTLIDEYLSSLTSRGIQFRNITFRGDILISKESIADYFYSLDESISIPNKMELVAKWLLQEIKIHQQKEKSKDWVLEQIELLDKEEYLQAYYGNQRVDEDDPSIEEDILRNIVVKKQFAGVKKQIKKYAFVNTLTTYQQLFMNWTTSFLPDNWDKIKELTKQYLTNKHLTWEDATPYRYFRGKLLGDKENRSIRHLFIDEAQDYSAFQFSYMKEIFPYTRMTLLGDINQAIYTYASTENPLVPEYISENHERIVLTKSYRSTKQIVEFTKKFAPGGDMIEPFERDGEPPQIIESQGDVSTNLKKLIQDLKAKDYETIAVICKTLEESNELYEMLKDKVSLKQIKEDTYSFEKGIVVVPVYLAKGIEFDAVIIPDASKEHYDQEWDRTLFYTACTRAMHSLTILTKGTPCIFIQEALN
ncbi:UvrD-helicase domain-containing protein [Ornithinibacillus sp. BX22]|uniref:UvrD-helicase domain-containing protein n=1 Tax=Ornithinibacillus hominis TaxID=2763055 RepID=A0A923RIL6_9BACI|nr:RNA polymerase recycling motor HelD [Ornithinibacillus hominis]MBC5637294.1 UvrD-helicase domain-containing protein [Ornithinibacillus hominis]